MNSMLPDTVLLLVDTVDDQSKFLSSFVRYYESSGAKNYVIAVIHGGYWKKKYGVDTSGIDSLVPYLLR